MAIHLFNTSRSKQRSTSPSESPSSSTAPSSRQISLPRCRTANDMTLPENVAVMARVYSSPRIHNPSVPTSERNNPPLNSSTPPTPYQSTFQNSESNIEVPIPTHVESPTSRYLREGSSSSTNIPRNAINGTATRRKRKDKRRRSEMMSANEGSSSSNQANEVSPVFNEEIFTTPPDNNMAILEEHANASIDLRRRSAARGDTTPRRTLDPNYIATAITADPGLETEPEPETLSAQEAFPVVSTRTRRKRGEPRSTRRTGRAVTSTEDETSQVRETRYRRNNTSGERLQRRGSINSQTRVGSTTTQRSREIRQRRRRRRISIDTESIPSIPPPMDEYSNVASDPYWEDDSPPYRERLHKNVDLISFDPRYTVPVLRINKALIRNDKNLQKCIKKMCNLNMLPEEVNLWDIDRVDDREFNALLPSLLPDFSDANSIVTQLREIEIMEQTAIPSTESELVQYAMQLSLQDSQTNGDRGQDQEDDDDDDDDSQVNYYDAYETVQQVPRPVDLYRGFRYNESTSYSSTYNNANNNTTSAFTSPPATDNSNQLLDERLLRNLANPNLAAYAGFRYNEPAFSASSSTSSSHHGNSLRLVDV
ncbi:uncharacterized protein RJT20DRAFT_42410 [Scheffersomyces xylosifermentans]|uniref:uncharacterized protein n=1 Tax=Scheffersomyces xylosifermentans TaxID=1304137 RepID=UPI00315CE65D